MIKKKMNISSLFFKKNKNIYIMESIYIRMQKKNPLGLCAIFPIDIRKIELIEINYELFMIKREIKLDLPHFFKASCLHCISMFIYGNYLKYIPHFSERHSEIPLHENALFYSIYFKKNIDLYFNPSSLFAKKQTTVFSIPSLPTSFSQSEKEESELLLQKFEKSIEDIKITNNFETIDEKEEIIELKPIELKTHTETVKNGNNDMIKDLIIAKHPLDNNFSIGKLYDFNIEIRNADGYIRAGSVRDNNRKLKPKEGIIDKWKKSEKTKELIEAYSKELNLSADKLIIKVTNTINDLRGIYLHPDLIIDYASWLSVSFKIYTQRILMKFFSNEALDKLHNQIRLQTVKINEKESTIERLERKIDEISNTVTDTRNTMQQAITYVSGRKNRICPKVDDDFSHLFIISEVIDIQSQKKKDNFYYMTRIQKKSRNATLKKKGAEHKAVLVPIYEIQSANPIELSNKITQVCKVDTYYSEVTINTTEEVFIKSVDKIVNEEIEEFLTIVNKYK